MIVDRFGLRISIGWSEREEAWCDAILDMGSNPNHLLELSDATGRSLSAIRQHIAQKRQTAVRERERAYRREKLRELAGCLSATN